MLFGRRRVATKAPLVIGRRVHYQRLVRVMARNASQTTVSSIAPTPALLQAVGRKPDGQDPFDSGEGNVPLGSMASATELD